MDQLGEGSREKLGQVDKGDLPPILLLTPGGTEGEIAFAGGGDDGEVPLRLRNDPLSYNAVGVIALEIVEHHGHNISSKTGLNITLLARRSPVLPGQMAVLPDFVVCLREGLSTKVAEGAVASVDVSAASCSCEHEPDSTDKFSPPPAPANPKTGQDNPGPRRIGTWFEYLSYLDWVPQGKLKQWEGGLEVWLPLPSSESPRCPHK